MTNPAPRAGSVVKKKAGPLDTQEAKTPEHESIYRRLREMILFGEVEPGQPLTIMGLRDAVGAGMTPVREAIRRLTAEGALSSQGNRRINVPVLTLNHLEEIRFARLAIEPELARRAATKVDSALLNDLEVIDRHVDDAILRGDIRAYLEHNHRFHFRLYSQAGTEVLQTIAESLWMRVGPSLRIVCGRFGTANLPDYHTETRDALAAGDPPNVKAAIERDIRQGLEQIRLSITESA